MNLKYLVFLMLFGVIACSQNESGDQQKSAPTKEQLGSKEQELTSRQVPEVKEVIQERIMLPSEVCGIYVGDFIAEVYKANRKPSYANKINITIEKFSQDSVFGHSVVAGNARPFKGTFTRKENTFYSTVWEPGDDRYDGEFYLQINGMEQMLEGKWTANDTNLAVTERKFALAKKSFQYDPNVALPEQAFMLEDGEGFYEAYDEETGLSEMPTDDVLKYNPSNSLLKKEDVENMYQGDLEIMRNSIYARHGYSFKNRRMRYVFDRYVDWYIPMKTNILADLTEIEKKNIELIKRYEQHAEKYYDSFGR